MARARRLVAAHLPEIAREFAASPAGLRARLEEPLSYSYFVPWHASRQPDCSLDIIVSRTVLEHIPADMLEDYMSPVPAACGRVA